MNDVQRLVTDLEDAMKSLAALNRKNKIDQLTYNTVDFTSYNAEVAEIEAKIQIVQNQLQTVRRIKAISETRRHATRTQVLIAETAALQAKFKAKV